MSNTVKSIILICCFVAIGVVGYMFYPLVFETIMGNKYYTSQEAQDLYDRGFNDGNKNKTELEEKNTYFETLVNEYYSKIDELNKELIIRETEYELSTKTIDELSNSKQELELQVETLTSIKQENEQEIQSSNEKINELERKINDLLNDKNINQNEIITLRNQIENLQTLNTQLQRTNELNAETITTLNTQISNLNTQISDMTMQVQNNSSIVTTLNNRISELEKSIAYYEQYISSLENSEQVVVTFEFNGSIYNIQVLNKGSKASVITPTSTEKVIFNYWEINGGRIDLDTYIFNSNVKVIANVTLKNKVQFSANDDIVNTQYILKNCNATLPATPTKDGYIFEYWTINGVDKVNVESYQITEDTIFYARFTKLHNVTFIYEDEIVNTQKVKNGEFVSAPVIESTSYKIFNGWLLNSSSVNVSNYKITADTVFNASITYYYEVQFIVDDEVYDTQIIKQGLYANVPTNPAKDKCVFDGWSINGISIIDVSNYVINDEIIFVAVFTEFAYGLYDKDNNLVLTWEELRELNHMSVDENGILTTSKMNDFYPLMNGTLNISNEVKGIGYWALSNYDLICIYIPNTVTSIGEKSFYGCAKLEEVKFEEDSNLVSIGKSAFEECTRLKTIEIPVGVTEIPDNAFQNSGIRSVNLLGKITRIGEFAFASTGLSKFVIPESVISIGKNAFLSYQDTTIFIPNSVIEIASQSESEGIFGYTNKLTIYCQTIQKPTLWGEYWNYTYDFSEMKYVNTKFTVKWGYTYEQYLSEVGM